MATNRDDLLINSGRLSAANQIYNNIKTESALLEDMQNKICKSIGPWFHYIGVAAHAEGYQTWRLKDKKLDEGQKEWTWVLRNDRWSTHTDAQVEVKFKNPYYRDASIDSHDPVKKGRQPETAFTFVVENKSDAPVVKDIKRTVQISTGKVKTKSSNLHFDVSSQLEAGTSGQEANGGTTALFTFKASFGGSFTDTDQRSDLNVTTREIADQLTLTPMSYYEVEAYYDKIDLERTIELTGIADFEIEIKTGPGWKEHWLGEDRSLTIKAGSVYEMIRELTGKGETQLPKAFNSRYEGIWFHDFAELWAGVPDLFNGLKWLAEPENRKMTATQVYEYDGASDVSLRVVKENNYDYVDGEYVKVTPTADPSPVQAQLTVGQLNKEGLESIKLNNS